MKTVVAMNVQSMQTTRTHNMNYAGICTEMVRSHDNLWCFVQSDNA